ncbi:Ras-like protein [Elysia marginata]|uniref:small monomeric GTPase n=1 Tax=Elysia marginata TaxID=1093978 RepID=A0AAV4IMG1_9GAST|nr:Ras-like protein [Elysia marginata]
MIGMQLEEEEKEEKKEEDNDDDNDVDDYDKDYEDDDDDDGYDNDMMLMMMIMMIMIIITIEDNEPSRYLKWADAFLVVYSITSSQSFQVAREYMESISLYLKSQGRDCPVALVGNKIDLERYRQVNKSEGASLATEYETVFYETTAAEEYELLERVFQRVIQEAHFDKYGHILQPIFIADDRPTAWGQNQYQPLQYHQSSQSQPYQQHQHHPQQMHHQHRRPKSPKGAAEKKDEKNQQKKTLNKFFKIFN